MFDLSNDRAIYAEKLLGDLAYRCYGWSHAAVMGIVVPKFSRPLLSKQIRSLHVQRNIQGGGGVG